MSEDPYKWVIYELMVLLNLMAISLPSLFFQIPSFHEKYVIYRSNLASIEELQWSSNNVPHNLSALQNDTNIDFFRDKLSFIFYSSTVIILVYLWHRTIRLLPCLLIILILWTITFTTDLLLYSENTIMIVDNVCMSLIWTMIALEIFMPHVCDDPLLWSCLAIYDTPTHYRDRHIFERNIKVKHLYERLTKIKQSWNIEEEKVVLTAITLPLAACFTLIFNLNGFILP